MRRLEVIGLSLVPVAAVVSDAYGADYLTVEQAQLVIFPDAVLKDTALQLTESQMKQIKTISGVRQRKDTQPVWRAEDRQGNLLGWFLVDEVIGKHNFITYAVGISASNTVIGVEILSYRETYGGQVRNPGWLNQFAGKSLSDPFQLDMDVQNISGATLSCRNVTKGVKRLLALHEVALAHE